MLVLNLVQKEGNFFFSKQKKKKKKKPQANADIHLFFPPGPQHCD